MEDLDDEGGKAGHGMSKGKEQGLEVNGCCGMGYRKSNIASLEQRFLMT